MRRRYSVTVGGQETLVELEAVDGDGTLRVTVGGVERVLQPKAGPAGRWSWLDGTRVVNTEVEAVGGKLVVTVRGETLAATVEDAAVAALPGAAAGTTRTSTGPVTLRAPMPGRVVKLLATAGQEVKAGAGVLVVEAMKMENEIRTPRDGRLRMFEVGEGTAVEAGQTLAVID